MNHAAVSQYSQLQSRGWHCEHSYMVAHPIGDCQAASSRFGSCGQIHSASIYIYFLGWSFPSSWFFFEIINLELKHMDFLSGFWEPGVEALVNILW